MQTDDSNKSKVYDKLRLVVYYTNSADKPFSKDFTVDIRDYCEPTLLTQTSNFYVTAITYTIGDPNDQVSNFASDWTTVPETCNLTYKFTFVSALVPSDPNLIVLKEDAPISVTVQTNDVFVGGGSSGTRNAGSYQVELRAWADNDFDTGEFILLDIVVVDPCTTAILTIDDTVFLT